MEGQPDPTLDREAHHLLERLYEATGGNTASQYDPIALALPHGMTPEQAEQAVSLLEARGLVRRISEDLVTITAEGVALIESEFGLSKI
ncbi:MAG: hypothetical protein ACOYEW_05215 [Anaerolineae bacterium]|jgi:Mn-dependent DtxR family transcriptional regulator